MRRGRIAATIAAGTALAGIWPGSAGAVPVGDTFELAGDLSYEVEFNARANRWVAVTGGSPYGFQAESIAVDDAGDRRFLFRRTLPPGFATSDRPAFAHDPERDEYLVVPSAPTEVEPFVAHRYGADGTLLGTTTIAPEERTVHEVVHNRERHEYLVLYSTLTGLVTQRLGGDGELRGDPTLVSDRAALYPGSRGDVAVRPGLDEYLVVWKGASGGGRPAVHGQRLRGDGREVGEDDVVLSEPIPLQRERVAGEPAVAHEPDRPRALVVWSDGTEVHGRRLRGARARPAPEVVRYSLVPPPGQAATGALGAAVAFHPAAREYLVLYGAPVRAAPEEPERGAVFGQHVRPNGEPFGPPSFRISPLNDLTQGGPTVAPDAGRGYLALWSGWGGGRNGLVLGRRLGTLRR